MSRFGAIIMGINKWGGGINSTQLSAPAYAYQMPLKGGERVV
jgi:hypothetical protein